MSIKNILVHIDLNKSSTARLNAAIELAQKYDAHLSGLYVIPNINIPAYSAAYIPSEVLVAQKQSARESAKKAQAEFKTIVDKAGCMNEWHCVQGYTDQQINLHARYADLIVIGQTEGQSLLSNEMAIEDHVLMDSVRPILFIPYIGVSTAIGKRIMVAWNGTREAVRAVSDALPLLERADSVDVVAVNPAATEGNFPTADICQYLARHDVNTEASQIVAKDISVADALLSRAADQNIDLIVMGAYGHSRLREFVFGGVTHDILEHMTLPVLMSH